MEHKLYHSRFLKHIISAPFTWIVIIPVIFLDIIIELYQHICFPLWKIKIVKRNKYIRIDRHKLSYLNFLEKINCMYCGYVNGVIHYWLKIAADTEEYWCGIKHKKYPGFIQQPHQKNFLEYGDEKSFRKKFSIKR